VGNDVFFRTLGNVDIQFERRDVKKVSEPTATYTTASSGRKIRATAVSFWRPPRAWPDTATGISECTSSSFRRSASGSETSS
jgi:hypothetical protein